MRPSLAIKDILHAFSLNYKTIFGMPNYEQYLKHHAEHHPEEKPMTASEYYVYALNERYNSGKINRCC
ncbi:MAG: YbdD/YjiX family protein [Candidatus Carbobacillus altaicus]|uniref:Small protein yjiX n=1 Tax=Candidatus Carbonibacillus altaicus TaxID=2163959 RepID=A0A2R6Y2T9_9BACL|nr:YbdD/YjiX family protein [Candidatus Carbobacillus altaicus]PTQ56997.1 MAG: hypothetical protein BSOLF_2399 [Candidatus Carbobacillus altaicus]